MGVLLSSGYFLRLSELYTIKMQSSIIRTKHNGISEEIIILS